MQRTRNERRLRRKSIIEGLTMLSILFVSPWAVQGLVEVIL
ncbi:MAG: hypothetical protein E7G43_15380 [Flavonifractor plautii]|jgi:hypothetical protein|nr:hypothetical protein [Flavonifractor plautii]MCQ5309538.1 hypothetical protein [Flavonifractor plautii]MDU3012385.1 hypothetical protein [Flavonifractor plautii]MDU3781321.1 hypothetical protein [Flavonifractor plautii]